MYAHLREKKNNDARISSESIFKVSLIYLKMHHFETLRALTASEISSFLTTFMLREDQMKRIDFNFFFQTGAVIPMAIIVCSNFKLHKGILYVQ